MSPRRRRAAIRTNKITDEKQGILLQLGTILFGQQPRRLSSQSRLRSCGRRRRRRLKMTLSLIERNLGAAGVGATNICDLVSRIFSYYFHTIYIILVFSFCQKYGTFN